MPESYDLIVVGGGIAGSAAAFRAVQYNLRTCWIYGDRKTSKASRSKWVYNVDNMIGIHDGIYKDELIRSLRAELDDTTKEKILGTHVHISGRSILKNTRDRIESDYADFIDIVDAKAESVGKNGSVYTVSAGERRVSSDFLVLATGVMDRQPHIEKERGGEIFDSTHWIYPYANRETFLYCIRCEGHLTQNKRAAVIGAGESAAQLAMMLHERYRIKVALFTNGENLVASDTSLELLECYDIPVYNTRITDVSGDRGILNAVGLKDGTTVNVDYALIALGIHRVYNDLAVMLGAELGNEDQPVEIRHVKVDKKGETSVKNLFAVGDMAMRDDEIVMKQIYTAQEYAVRTVDTIDYRIRRARRAAILNGK